MDRAAWRTAAHGVAKSWTRLKCLHLYLQINLIWIITKDFFFSHSTWEFIKCYWGKTFFEWSFTKNYYKFEGVLHTQPPFSLKYSAWLAGMQQKALYSLKRLVKILVYAPGRKGNRGRLMILFKDKSITVVLLHLNQTPVCCVYEAGFNSLNSFCP